MSTGRGGNEASGQQGKGMKINKEKSEQDT